MATSDRSGKRSSRSLAAAKSRRKASTSSTEASSGLTPDTSGPVDPKNVGSLEGARSLILGFLLIIAALFPRSIRQLLMLGLGSGLAYRGITRECGVYKSLGIDTAND